MSEFTPVTTLVDLESLDSAEVYEGYCDGLDGDPEPGNNRSRSYWHGWRNGHVDGGFAEPDDAMMTLAHVAAPGGDMTYLMQKHAKT